MNILPCVVQADGAGGHRIHGLFHEGREKTLDLPLDGFCHPRLLASSPPGPLEEAARSVQACSAAGGWTRRRRVAAESKKRQQTKSVRARRLGPRR